MARLDGKVALVTGSSRGIGSQIALRLAHEGAHCAVCYNKEESMAETIARRIENSGGRAFAVRLSVTDRASVRRAAQRVVETFGKIDILVNNAGINKPNDFDRISDEEWHDVLDVNLTGAFKVTQELLPFMADGGSIVNISSVSGQYGGPRTTHYCVSKAGLIALTQNLAIFCARRNIRVNAIAPGLIESEMAGAATGLGVSEKILLRRMGTAEEVASVAVFLASSDSSYMTAQTLNVNGGLYF